MTVIPGYEAHNQKRHSAEVSRKVRIYTSIVIMVAFVAGYMYGANS